MKKRDDRHKVLIDARLRDGSAWADVRILNVSARGLMAECDEAPAPKTYIEIRRGSQIIVGKTVWRDGRRFGARTQDRMDIGALVAAPASNGCRPDGSIERRAQMRARPSLSLQERAERSRAVSAAIQFGAIALIATGAATLIGIAIGDVLARPLAIIGSSLIQ